MVAPSLMNNDAGCLGCIADLYFFEELSACIGEEETFKWLSAQCAGVDLSRAEQSSAAQYIVSSTAQMGRDTPSSKPNETIKGDTRSGQRQYKTVLAGKRPNQIALSNDDPCRSPKRSPLSPLSKFVDSLGLESKSLSRTMSVERKLGLLFTDAAHTILD